MSFMQNERNVVNTNKNTTFEDWKSMCAAEFVKRGFKQTNPNS
jgi:hypothetical protein